MYLLNYSHLAKPTWEILETSHTYPTDSERTFKQRLRLLTKTRPEPNFIYRIANPFCKITCAALISRSKCLPQFGQSHSRTANHSDLFNPNR